MNKQDRKELLLKDICARLPYGVKCEVYNCIGVLDEVTTFYGVGVTYSNGQDTTCRIDECKPYLFPLSSMTDEQRKEYENALTYHDYVKGGWTIAKTFDDEYVIPYWFVDFCNKHHFDYRGLIPMKLAIDATGLNIY